MARVGTIDELYLPNRWMPFGAAITCHFMLLAWNPTLMPANPLQRAPAPMEVKVLDKMPSITEVKKPEPVKPKPIVKKVVKKAHKSGLSLSRPAKPIPVTTHAVVHAKATPHPFQSKITMPKFIPHASDEPLAASPAPGISAPSPHRMVQAFAPPAKLRGKTRGVRASDINFELTDKGSLSSSGFASVAIPVGEERGETASLPNAAVLHDAPKGIKTVSGYRYQPGTGSGSGELAGKDRKSFAGGYHGVIQSDEYIEGSLSGGGGGKGKGKSIGNGIEIGGPVGDRKILKKKLPEYPAWAEEKGISAMVKIYFTVKSDGTIRQSMRIERSSGYTELDDLAKAALMSWRFSPTTADSSEQEAWGIITFRFTIA